MRRGTVASLVFIVVVAVGALVGTLVAGDRPELGLDLQGGTSVVLEPKNKVSEGILDQSIGIIRNRVDALGVSEPDISRLGDNIIVSLAGVDDADRALAIVGQTAELRFRPVLETLPPEGVKPSTTSTAPADPNASTTTTTEVPTTPREADQADQVVVLPELDDDGNVVARYRLGPAEMTGKALKSARADFQAEGGQWSVAFTLTGEGSTQFDEVAKRNYQRQLAIVLDGVVKSAPQINATEFKGTGTISGDFTEREAKDLALVLRYGSLPVELEPQSTQKVSATLGKDSLRAGVAAGLAGLALVLLYMVLYYRALGLVVLLGLCVWGMLMWSIISFLGVTLTLAGAVGIVISVGVTVDSYVVYFERLKDEIRSGKTVRSSVDRGFTRAFRTILAADVSSFIGAFLLFWLTIGSVRGFAFFLGLSTLLDVVVAWFFTRPLVGLLGRNRVFTEARWLGVARGLAVSSAGSPS